MIEDSERIRSKWDEIKEALKQKIDTVITKSVDHADGFGNESDILSNMVLVDMKL